LSDCFSETDAQHLHAEISGRARKFFRLTSSNLTPSAISIFDFRLPISDWQQ
jgi:hypothetical protein